MDIEEYLFVSLYAEISTSLITGRGFETSISSRSTLGLPIWPCSDKKTSYSANHVQFNVQLWHILFKNTMSKKRSSQVNLLYYTRQQ